MNDYDRGAVMGLIAFRDQLIEDRGLIENEDEPAFDVIVGLLTSTINALGGFAGVEVES